jgi:hypothetical protein
MVGAAYLIWAVIVNLRGVTAMATSVKQMMEAANAAVPRITSAQAREMIAKGNTLVVDVRDAPEVEKSGKVAGALNVSRGMLEFRADPESPYHDKNFAKDKTPFIALLAAARLWVERYSKRWATIRSTISAPSRIGLKAAAQSTSQVQPVHRRGPWTRFLRRAKPGELPVHELLVNLKLQRHLARKCQPRCSPAPTR